MKFLTIILFIQWTVYNVYAADAVPAADCPKFCPLSYVPVCAKDKNGNTKEFPHECVLRSRSCSDSTSGWVLLNEGPCPVASVAPPPPPPIAVAPKECNSICNKALIPVCGQDKTGNTKTFSNKCLYTYAECSEPENEWKLISEERCPEPVATTEAPCSRVCTKEYFPICGTNAQGVQETFGNQCMFNVRKCEEPDNGWTSTEGACGDQKPVCNTACADIYKPVCGQDSDGKQETYSNDCEFKIAECQQPEKKWKLVSKGKCDEPAPVPILDNNCQRACPAIFLPVCAQDNNGEYQTFGNLCSLNSTQCADSTRGWRYVGEGECPTVDPVAPVDPVDGSGCQNIACPAIYAPVCAQDAKGNTKTFPSVCDLTSAQCLDAITGWVQISETECPSPVDGSGCQTACPYSYEPLCAQDANGNTNTFGNLCGLQAAQCTDTTKGWVQISEGECPSPVNDDCEFVCTAIYDPVCARNAYGELRTISSSCIFQSLACQEPENKWEVIRSRACEDVQPTKRPRKCNKKRCPNFFQRLILNAIRRS